MRQLARFVLLLSIASLVFLAAGCSDSVSPGDSGVNTCTTNDECPAGQVCNDGICSGAGTDCSDGGLCPEGQVCVDDICIPDNDGAPDGGDGEDGEDGDGGGDELPPEPDIEVIEPGTTEDLYQLNFGNVLVGEPVTKQIILENAGQEELRIMQLNFEMGTDVDDFSIPQATLDSLPAVMGAGDQLVIDVVYLATDGATDHGILDIISNDPDEALVQIHLLSEFKGEARVQVDKLALDFGEIPVMTNSAPLGFIVTNNGTGNAVLTVEDIRFELVDNPNFSATISDSAGQPSTFPHLLNNGDFLDVSVSYHPQQAGPNTDNVVVISNDAINSSLQVAITGTGVVGDLGISPSPVDLGQVRVNTHGEQVVTLTNSGGADLSISGVSLPTDASLEWSLSSTDLDLATLETTPHVLGAAQSVTVTIGFDPADVGLETTTLLVDNSSAEPQRSVTLTAEGFLPAAVETDPAPPNLNFGNVQYDELTGISERADLQVQITNVGGQPLEINNIALSTLTSAEYSFAPSSISNIDLGVSVPLTVSFEPALPYMPGARQGAIVVDTNDPDISQDGITGRFLIVMQANAIDPNIFVSPSSGVDFGDTFLGQQKTQTFTIRNAGTGSLRVDEIVLTALSSSSYVIQNPPSLPAILSSFAQELTFDVVYTPADASLHEGQVQIVSTDLGNPLETLTLSGNASGCPAGTLDCDLTDGWPCETNITNDPFNCGGCDVVCALANASSGCLDSQCTVITCDGDYENCDGNDANGCEVDGANDPLNCGNCDIECTYDNAAGVCNATSCEMGTCASGYIDVDLDDSNGCECLPDNAPMLCDSGAIDLYSNLGALPNSSGNQILISGQSIYPAGDEDWYTFTTLDNYSDDVNGCGTNCGDAYSLNIHFEDNPQGNLLMDVYRSYDVNDTCGTRPLGAPGAMDSMWQGLVCSGHSDDYSHTGQNPCWDGGSISPPDSVVPRVCRDETSRYWVRVYRTGSTVTCDPYQIRISFTQ